MTTSTQSRRDAFNERTNALFAARKAATDHVVALEDAPADTTAYRRALRQARRRVDEATHAIVEANIGLVRSYVRRFTATTSAEYNRELEAAGIEGLIRAIDNFDPDRGRFASWAYKPIQRQVLKAFQGLEFANLNAVDFDRRPAIRRAVVSLYGRDWRGHIDYEAVAAEAGCSVGQVQRVVSAATLLSLSATVNDTDDATLSDQLVDPTVNVEASALSGMSIDALETHALPVLDERERLVIVRRFGLDGEPEQNRTEIGAMLGLSREAVRQTEARAVAKISHPITLAKLAGHTTDSSLEGL